MSSSGPIGNVSALQSISAPAPELSIEEGQDYIIDEATRLPLEPQGVLGHGLSGYVEKVRDRNSNRVYAKKTIRVYAGRNRAQNEERFRNEVDIIRKVEGHPHIIRVFATLAAQRELCMLLEPVANSNLFEFLANYKEYPERATAADTDTLERCFGCLASALAYIHKKNIRHKDIKPENILISEGRVIYTDFGASKAFNGANESTTEGRPDFLTRKYSAPEVLDHDRRNKASDVFSLGCVFVEVISALCRGTVTYDETKPFSESIETIHARLLHAHTFVPSKLSCLPDLITSMTLLESSRRAIASHVSRSICTHDDLCCEKCYELDPRFQSEWTWSSAKQRYFSYVYEGHVVVETKWSDTLIPVSASQHSLEAPLPGY